MPSEGATASSRSLKSFNFRFWSCTSWPPPDEAEAAAAGSEGSSEWRCNLTKQLLLTSSSWGISELPASPLWLWWWDMADVASIWLCSHFHLGPTSLRKGFSSAFIRECEASEIFTEGRVDSETLTRLLFGDALGMEPTVCSVVTFSEGLLLLVLLLMLALALAVECEDFNWLTLKADDAFVTPAETFCVGCPSECGFLDEMADSDTSNLVGKYSSPLVAVLSTEFPPTEDGFTTDGFTEETVNDLNLPGADFSWFTSKVFGSGLVSRPFSLPFKAVNIAAMAGDAFSLATGNRSLNFVLGVGDLTFTAKSFGDDEAAEVLEDFSLLIMGVMKFTGLSSIKPPAEDFPPCPQESSCRFAVVLLTNG